MIYLRPLLDEGAMSSWSPTFRVLWNHPIWIMADFDISVRPFVDGLRLICRTCNPPGGTFTPYRGDLEAEKVITPNYAETHIHTFEWMGPIAYSRQSIFAGACRRCNTVMWGPANSTITNYETWQFEKIAESQANVTRLHTSQDSKPQ